MYKGFLLASLVLFVPVGLWGCQPATETPSETTAETENDLAANGGESGTLTLIADAEDRMREGFVSKDGWRLEFEEVYVTFNNVRAYQADPAFDPETDTTPNSTRVVELITSPQTVDLVGGEEETPTVVTKTAPAGHYNALYWEMVPAEMGEATGSSLFLKGTATKEGRSIDFAIALDKPVSHYCGEYVGDVRKGFLPNEETAELEMTLHFDHFFGRSDRDPDESPNAEAIGFEPFAQLAEGDSLTINSEQLRARLSEEDYQTLVFSVTELGHVGEGHCRVEPLS
ncbi:hypothetical protein K4A83_16525 [Spirulina subsalsa FACHB-351]|uniref:DUF4382 domain-containing protein n=1 Tax=Spirulina subsalsa FACHB-351 TaxID=234711 RepID=A0ABT3L8N1_9CYAN|nr:hypothetical protein [Spirulina subsalsa]MCW6037866.1 hypothetical protein [Spirulina subsalsa FACHB-351]